MVRYKDTNIPGKGKRPATRAVGLDEMSTVLKPDYLNNFRAKVFRYRRQLAQT